MAEVVFEIESEKPLWEQAVPGHNRWHPDIPAAATVKPGSEFRVECAEWTDYQITRSPNSDEIRGRQPEPRPFAERPDRRRGRGARRYSGCRHPRYRRGPRLGLHRHLLEGERRRLPDRLLPRRPQGGLGSVGDLCDIGTDSRRPLRRPDSPRPHWMRTLTRSARRVEPPRGTPRR